LHFCHSKPFFVGRFNVSAVGNDIYIFTLLSKLLTRYHNVIETGPTGAILILRTTTDCPERRKVLDFVEVSPLIVVVVMIINVGARERRFVRLNDRIGIINLLLSLLLILFRVRVLIRTLVKLNGIIIIFGFV
jgi:hypothetical protein